MQKTNVMLSSPTHNQDKPIEKSKFKTLIEQQDKNFLAQLDKLHPIRDTIDENDKTVKLLNAFTRMHSMGNYFNAETLRQKQISNLLEDPEALDLVRSILLDFDQTLAKYDKQQALARVYAIKILKSHAKNGDSSLLYEITSNLALQLDQNLKNNEAIKYGRQYDLQSLLTLTVDTMDIGELKNGNSISALLTNIGYKDDFSNGIKEYYDNAIFFPLLRAYGREKASKLLEPYIQFNKNL